ncbi:MAG: HAD family hydrolase [Treponema sp.]|nr:HAD family hydrolase [Treponema sp.]
MSYKLVVFDLDGTILNTLDDLADSLNIVCQKYNFPTFSYEEVKYMVGNGIPKLIERAIPEGKTNPAYKDFLNDYIKYYENHSKIKTSPYPHMKEVLLKLKEAGVKLGVNSNKIEDAVIPLCNFYFPGIFDFVSGGHLDRKPKPDPAGLNAILAKAEECRPALYVGDSDVDIQTGKNAGIDVLSVAWGFRGRKFLEENGAMKVIDQVPQLLDEVL